MEKKKTLLLHIGHGKTGSSFLQTCFACSIDQLEAAGVDYPIDKAALEKARSGQTTMGNFPPVSREQGHSVDALKALVASVPDGRGQNVLISNEGLFGSIMAKGFLGEIVEAFPDREIRLLLFIRDPMNFIISAYQEMLKADLVGDIEDSFRKISMPGQVARILASAALADVETSVFNFDRHRSELKEVTETWLGLAPGTLRSGPRPVVNRSMDRSEILIQRAFNKHVGNRARRFIADPLTAELPSIQPRKPFIDHEVLADFLRRMDRDIQPVNARIPESEHYRVPSFEEAIATLPSRQEGDRIEISLEQLDVLALHISRFLPWRKVEPPDKSG